MKRLLRAALQPTLLGQLSSALLGLVQLSILSTQLSGPEYGGYSVVAAIWAISNAFAGVAIGTRVMRDSDEKQPRATLSLWDLAVSLLIAASGAAIVFAVGLGIWVATLTGVGTLTFVAVEIAISYDLGARKFWRFASRLAIRSGAAVVALACIATVSENLALAVALGAILLGNLIAAVVPRPPRLAFVAKLDGRGAMHAVGLISVSLWVVASADRVILGAIVPLDDLALYSFLYAMFDRALRIPVTSYVSKTLPAAFTTGEARWSTPFRWSAAAAVPLVVVLVAFFAPVLSGGRYVMELSLGLPIAAGLTLNWLAAPTYVRAVGRGELRWIATIAVAIAIMNCVANLLLAEEGGVLAAAYISAVSYGAYLVGLVLIPRRRAAAPQELQKGVG